MRDTGVGHVQLATSRAVLRARRAVTGIAEAGIGGVERAHLGLGFRRVEREQGHLRHAARIARHDADCREQAIAVELRIGDEAAVAAGSEAGLIDAADVDGGVGAERCCLDRGRAAARCARPRARRPVASARWS